MMMVQTLILLTMWLTLCVCCFLAGRYCAGGKRTAAPPGQADEKTIQRAKKAEKEYRQLLRYDGGEPDEEPHNRN